MFFLLSIIIHLSALSCLISGKEFCPDQRINFYLYTDENKEKPQLVAPNQDAILESNFKPGKTSKIIIHGLKSSIYKELQELKDAYLINKNLNVWMVDWEVLSDGLYPVVVNRLNHVGVCVAEFILCLQNATLTSFQESLHVIGFSLGAHVAAYAANHLKPYKLPRITGLDPAISFLPGSFDSKLNERHAQFVDVVHTDGLFQGRIRRCGHVDFYMNGGLIQPGCWNKFIPKSTTYCNHHRAISYFAESVTSEIGFWGWRCQSFSHYLVGKCPPQTPTVRMGEYCERNTTGYHIVTTTQERPFAIGRNVSKTEKRK